MKIVCYLFLYLALGGLCTGILKPGYAEPPTVQKAIQISDDRGHRLSLPKPAERIISLAPHITELLFVVGAGDRLVATVDFSDYPQQASRIPSIGGAGRIDMERLLALEPDIVLAWKSGNNPLDIAAIEKRGIPVYVMEPRSLAMIAEHIISLGDIVATEAVAKKAAEDFVAEVAILSETYANREEVSVFFQVWDQPLMTVNGDHMISKVIALCGGKTLFASHQPIAPVVSLEAVLAADPQVIISAEPVGKAEKMTREWQRWPRLQAVRNQNLVNIEPDTISRATPRILIGAKQICQALDKARKP